MLSGQDQQGLSFIIVQMSGDAIDWPSLTGPITRQVEAVQPGWEEGIVFFENLCPSNRSKLPKTVLMMMMM